jgi:hypothetical protein
MTKLRGPFFATLRQTSEKDEREDVGAAVFRNCGNLSNQLHIHTARKTVSKKIFSVEVLEMKYSVQQAVHHHHTVTFYTEYG